MAELPEDAPPRQRQDLHVPATTIIKVLASAVAVWAGLRLWPEFLLFLISVLLAVTLAPAVAWMERKRVPRSLGVVMIALLAIAVMVVVIGFVMPPLTAQVTHLIQDFPALRAKVMARIPADYPFMRRVVVEIFALPASPEVVTMLDRPLAWGRAAVTGIMATAIVLILTLYLLIDGRSMYAWLLAFVPRAHREKVATTTDEVSAVIHAYVGGQLLSALLFTGFTVTVLTIVGVPAVAPLALIAGICDVIPVLGIILATAPAVLLALTVSPASAAVVLTAYLVYHFFETYFLLPRIYGNKLRLSTLSVLLALIVGGTLQGVIGAVLVLPLVAAYPIIERHWLARYLNARVLTDHKAMAKAAETGSDVAIESVLHGEKHASEGPVPRPSSVDLLFPGRRPSD